MTDRENYHLQLATMTEGELYAHLCVLYEGDHRALDRQQLTMAETWCVKQESPVYRDILLRAKNDTEDKVLAMRRANREAGKPGAVSEFLNRGRKTSDPVEGGE